MANTKKFHVSLTDEEVSRSKKLAKSAESKKLILNRINILRDMDDANGKPLTYKQCVKSNATSIMNVYNVFHTYATEEQNTVLTIKRSCKSDVSNLKVDGKADAKLIQLACCEAPEGHARWIYSYIFFNLMLIAVTFFLQSFYLYVFIIM